MSRRANSHQLKKCSSEAIANFSRLLSKIRENGLLLDSCVLSYYLLSYYENKSGRKIRKDREISISLNKLNKIISIAGRIYTTPQILAEVSTKIRDIAGNVNKKYVWDICKERMVHRFDMNYV